jgi:hypothetical protein
MFGKDFWRFGSIAREMAFPINEIFIMPAIPDSIEGHTSK